MNTSAGPTPPLKQQSHCCSAQHPLTLLLHATLQHQLRAASHLVQPTEGCSVIFNMNSRDMWALFYIDKVAHLHWKKRFCLNNSFGLILKCILKKYAEFVIVVIVFHLISGIFQENLSIVCWKNDHLRLSLRLNYTLGYSNDFPAVHTFYHKRQIQRNRRSIHRMLLLNSIFTKCYYCVHFLQAIMSKEQITTKNITSHQFLIQNTPMVWQYKASSFGVSEPFLPCELFLNLKIPISPI